MPLAVVERPPTRCVRYERSWIGSIASAVIRQAASSPVRTV